MSAQSIRPAETPVLLDRQAGRGVDITAELEFFLDDLMSSLLALVLGK
jgi:hypothetical protein